MEKETVKHSDNNIIFTGGFLHGHIMDGFGTLYSLNVRFVFSPETGQIGIRAGDAYRCSESFDIKPFRIPLEPMFIPKDSNFVTSDDFYKIIGDKSD